MKSINIFFILFYIQLIFAQKHGKLRIIELFKISTKNFTYEDVQFNNTYISKFNNQYCIGILSGFLNMSELSVISEKDSIIKNVKFEYLYKGHQFVQNIYGQTMFFDCFNEKAINLDNNSLILQENIYKKDLFNLINKHKELFLFETEISGDYSQSNPYMAYFSDRIFSFDLDTKKYYEFDKHYNKINEINFAAYENKNSYKMNANLFYMPITGRIKNTLCFVQFLEIFMLDMKTGRIEIFEPSEFASIKKYGKIIDRGDTFGVNYYIFNNELFSIIFTKNSVHVLKIVI